MAKFNQPIRVVLGSGLAIAAFHVLPSLSDSIDGEVVRAAMPSPSAVSFVLFGVGAVLLRGVIGPESGKNSDS